MDKGGFRAIPSFPPPPQAAGKESIPGGRGCFRGFSHPPTIGGICLVGGGCFRGSPPSWGVFPLPLSLGGREQKYCWGEGRFRGSPPSWGDLPLPPHYTGGREGKYRGVGVLGASPVPPPLSWGYLPPWGGGGGVISPSLTWEAGKESIPGGRGVLGAPPSPVGVICLSFSPPYT